MPKKILICAQKGGSGKSLIADELAFSFERTGTPLSFYDLDEQGGTLHQTEERADAQAAVIDTPGALQPELAGWMTAADVIVIPTRCTSRDIEPLMRMREAAQTNAPQTPVVFVMNGHNRYNAARDFVEWFRVYAGRPTLCCLPQSESFVRAGVNQKSVVAYAPRSAAAAAVIELCNLVRSLAGLEPEPADAKEKTRSRA